MTTLHYVESLVGGPVRVELLDDGIHQYREKSGAHIHMPLADIAWIRLTVQYGRGVAAVRSTSGTTIAINSSSFVSLGKFTSHAAGYRELLDALRQRLVQLGSKATFVVGSTLLYVLPVPTVFVTTLLALVTVVIALSPGHQVSLVPVLPLCGLSLVVWVLGAPFRKQGRTRHLPLDALPEASLP